MKEWFKESFILFACAAGIALLYLLIVPRAATNDEISEALSDTASAYEELSSASFNLQEQYRPLEYFYDEIACMSDDEIAAYVKEHLSGYLDEIVEAQIEVDSASDAYDQAFKTLQNAIKAN